MEYRVNIQRDVPRSLNELAESAETLDTSNTPAWDRWSQARKTRFVAAIQQELVYFYMTGKKPSERVWKATGSRPYLFIRSTALRSDALKDAAWIQRMLPLFMNTTWKKAIDYVVAKPGRMPNRVRLILDPKSRPFPTRAPTGAARRRLAATLPEVQAWKAGYIRLMQLLAKWGLGSALREFRVQSRRVAMPSVPSVEKPFYARRDRRGRVDAGYDLTGRELANDYNTIKDVVHPSGVQTRDYAGIAEWNAQRAGTDTSTQMSRPEPDPIDELLDETDVEEFMVESAGTPWLVYVFMGFVVLLILGVSFFGLRRVQLNFLTGATAPQLEG